MRNMLQKRHLHPRARILLAVKSCRLNSKAKPRPAKPPACRAASRSLTLAGSWKKQYSDPVMALARHGVPPILSRLRRVGLHELHGGLSRLRPAALQELSGR